MNEINTPRGSIVKVNDTSVRLNWNKGFSPEWKGKYTLAQKFVDSEVLRHCDPLIPMQSGMLKQSGVLGTETGSGIVQWIAPYAKHQYYDTGNTRSYDMQRGAHWFERMKAEHGKEIVAGAKRLAGGQR